MEEDLKEKRKKGLGVTMQLVYKGQILKEVESLVVEEDLPIHRDVYEEVLSRLVCVGMDFLFPPDYSGKHPKKTMYFPTKNG